MGIFSRKSSRATEAPAVAPEPSAPPSLPAPRYVATRDDAARLLHEVGQIQREIMSGASARGAGDELVSRLEGVVLFHLEAGADRAHVFDELVAPISEWGMGRLFGPYLLDSDSVEGADGKQAFDIVCAFREKYQHLNPENR